MNRIKRSWLVPLSLICGLLGCHPHHASIYQGFVDADYIYLSSPVAGQLMHLYVAKGDKVSAGQLIFDLSPQPEQANLDHATAILNQQLAIQTDLSLGKETPYLKEIQAKLNAAIKQEMLAEHNLERYRALLKQGAVDQMKFDQIETDAFVSHNNVLALKANLLEAKLPARTNQQKAQRELVQAATAELQQAMWQMAQKKQTAPYDGVIQDTFYQQGEETTAFHPVVALWTPQLAHIEFYLPESDFPKIHLGDQVTIQCRGCAQTYQARISYISPQVIFEPPIVFQRGQKEHYSFTIQAQLSEADAWSLHPGQPVDVELSK